LKAPAQLRLESFFGDDLGRAERHPVALRRRLDEVTDLQLERQAPA